MNLPEKDEEIVDSLVKNLTTITRDHPARSRPHCPGPMDQGVVRSKPFVSRSDLDTDHSRSTDSSSASSLRMDIGLRIRPESPTASYESTSFESLHSEELGPDSCPLIFSVDDISSSSIPKPLASHPVQNEKDVQQTQETRRTRSDSEVLKEKVVFVGKYQDDKPYALPEVVEEKETTPKEKGQRQCQEHMKADERFVYQSNLREYNRPNLLVEPETRSPKSKHIPKSNDYEISDTSKNSPDAMIYLLEDQITSLADAVESIFSVHRDAKVKDELSLQEPEVKFPAPPTGESPEERTELQELAAKTKESWNLHKEHLFEFLSDFEQFESNLNDTVIRLQGQTSLCVKLKQERRDFQDYLAERERDWATIENSLRQELEFFRAKLFELSKKNVGTNSVWRMLESLMSVQYDRERAIILDAAKQNKLNEMKLLVFKQQLQIEELEEVNASLQKDLDDLNTTIRSNSPSKDGSSQTNTNNNKTSLCDVMYCDRQLYLPNHSTQPELASLQVFNVGGRCSNVQSLTEEIFQPDCLPQRLEEKNKTVDENLAQQLLDDLIQHGPASPGFKLDD